MPWFTGLPPSSETGGSAGPRASVLGCSPSSLSPTCVPAIVVVGGPGATGWKAVSRPPLQEPARCRGGRGRETRTPRWLHNATDYDVFYFPPFIDPLLWDWVAQIKSGIGGVFTKKTISSKHGRSLVTGRSTGLRTQKNLCIRGTRYKTRTNAVN